VGRSSRQMSRGVILEGAAAILDTGVYGDLTVGALARSLQMSKSTLYKYFNSKEDVVVALVDDAIGLVDQSLANDEEILTGKGPLALDRLIRVFSDYVDAMPRALMLHRRRLPSSCQDRMELTRVRLAQACREVIGRGVRDGAFRSVEPGIVAETIMSGGLSAVQGAARGEIEVRAGEAVRAVYRLVLPGLKA
jgi:AcrR family transcriptional regulator